MANNVFGGWSIDKSLFDWLQQNIKKDSIILELGSGNATKKLCEFWSVFSIEQNKDWVNKFHNNYIYAPLVNEWYDVSIVKNNLPKKVDAILIDGPTQGKRSGFVDNIEMFLNLKPTFLVFDDINRAVDLEAFNNVKKYLTDKKIVYESEIHKHKKHFGTIIF